MATESGAQGKLKAATTHLNVHNWTLESDPVLQEDTNAETGGHAHRASVKKDHKLTFGVFVSSGHQPEEDAIIEGNEVSMSLRVGTIKAYNAWTFIIGTVSLKGCDANGLAQYDVTAYAQAAKPTLGTWSD